jgi:predicted nucleic acid-binding protein
MLSLAIENDALSAAYDKPLRKVAKRLKIRVIGSLGLLKLLYLKGHMDNKKAYLNLLEKL